MSIAAMKNGESSGLANGTMIKSISARCNGLNSPWNHLFRGKNELGCAWHHPCMEIIMNFPRTIIKYLVILALALMASPAFAAVFVSVDIAPPVLPVYAQPACPGDGYMWTPGYWAYGPDGYYWVPGTWVLPPSVGLYWTPCYWGWGGSAFIFHAGYWGNHCGYYGGINYGCGYNGNGYNGGRWQGGHFAYNTAVTNVNGGRVHNTYVDRSVTNNNFNRSRVSYNGGRGGIQAQPTAQDRQFANERHVQPTSVQQAHQRTASRDRGQLASVNGGRPTTVTAAKPQSYSAAKKEPITAQDRQRTQQQASVAKNGTQGSSNQQFHPEKKTASVNSVTHTQEALPQTHQAPQKSVEKPAVTHHESATPQFHPQSHPQAQVHAPSHAAESHPQSHPQSHAPQAHSGGGGGGGSHGGGGGGGHSGGGGHH
jgi:uncharacterized membrane protein YgcG